MDGGYPPGVIVGREPELKELAAAAVPVVGGRGSLVLIDGEAGIGKTRLVSELAGRLEGDGFAVAWSTCREGGAPPFWPWVQLLRRLPKADAGIPSGQQVGGDSHSFGQGALGASDYGHPGSSGAPGPLARLLAPEAEAAAGTDAQVDRFLLFDAVAEELRAAGQPLLLVLEDLHWADEASLRLLAFLAGELHTVPALVVGTYRTGEVDGPAVTAMRPDRRIPLAGMAVAELNEAVEGLTGEPLDERLLEPVHARTGGNPFFAVELVRLLRSEGRRTEPIPSTTLPASVRMVLERRLARLPSGTHVLLRAAAVLGQELTLPALASITAPRAAPGLARPVTPPGSGQTTAGDPEAEMTVERVADLLEPAIEAGLVQPVEERPGHLVFVHDLVRETLEAQLEVGERRDLHERAGAVLLADAQDDATGLARAAHHLLEAAALGAPPDQAIETASVAARLAMDGLAYEEALTLLSHALALLDAGPTPGLEGEGQAAARSPVDRVQLLLDQGAAAVAAGSLEVARTAHLEAARLARRDGRVNDMARAGLGLAAGAGGFEVSMFDSEQLDLLEEVLRLLPEEDSELRAQVTARLSVALSFVEGDERRGELAAEALAMARRLDDASTLAAALAAHCDAIAGPDHVRERLDEASEIIAIAQTQRNRALELLGRRLRLIALAELGDWSGVDDEIVRFSLTANLVRQPLYQWYVPLWRGMRALMQGEVSEAEQFDQEVRRLAGLSGSPNAALLADVQRFVYLVWAGDAAAGREAVMNAVAASDPAILEHAALSAIRAFTLASDGQMQESRAVLGSSLDDILALPRDSEWLASMTYAAYTSALVADIGAAERVYGTLEPYAGLFSVDGIAAGCWGSVDAYLGLLALRLGREAKARDHLAAAVELDNRAGVALGERSRRWAGLAAAELSSARFGPPAASGGSSGSATEAAGAPGAATAVVPADEPTFRLLGDVWTFGFEGRAVQARDAKGYHDIATLLQAPGRPVHVADLVGGGVDPGSSGELVDRQALNAYRERLLDLEEDLAEAEAAHDAGRAEALHVERDMLVDELTSVAGLGGRPREATSQVERARKAVTNRVRHGIGRIEKLHPELGRHLRASVKTGTLCCYEPEHPVSWRL